MQRVLVVGPCGAGKSTLAFALADRLGLPLYHLDKLYWQPGWVEGDDDQLDARIEEIVAGDRWLLEGTYGRTLPLRLPHADTVVYLDYAIPLCLWRLVKRIWRWRGATRPDMGDGCEERFDLAFMTYVAGWRSGPGKRLEKALAGYEDKVVRLKSPRETDRWLAAIAPG